MPLSVLPCGLRPERVLDDRRRARARRRGRWSRSCRSRPCGPSTPAGSCVASWTRSKTLTVPVWTSVRPDERVPRMLGQERPGRIGLDGRADADEAAALLEVRLEVRALRVGQRARHARVQEHDRAVGVEAAGVNCAPTSAGAGAVTVKSAPAAAWIAAMPAADRVLGARDDEHLGRIRRRGLRPRRRRGRQHQSQAQERQTHLVFRILLPLLDGYARRARPRHRDPSVRRSPDPSAQRRLDARSGSAFQSTNCSNSPGSSHMQISRGAHLYSLIDATDRRGSPWRSPAPRSPCPRR